MKEITEFHNKQSVIFQETQDVLKSIELEMKQRIEELNEKSKSLDEAMEKCKAMRDSFEKKLEETSTALRQAKAKEESAEANRLSSIAILEESNKVKALNEKESRILEKQKEALDKINNGLIQKGREQEMEDRRLENLQIYINKVISDKHIKKELEGYGS